MPNIPQRPPPPVIQEPILYCQSVAELSPEQTDSNPFSTNTFQLYIMMSYINIEMHICNTPSVEKDLDNEMGNRSKI